MNERVKLIRKQLGMTQEQLAQRLGIGKAALSMIETGKAGLSARNRNILVQELNVNPEWLESGKGNIFNAEPYPTAYIHPEAELGENVSIGPNVVVGRNSKIGNNSKLLANCYVGKNCTIGENCLFHAGCCIGDNSHIGNRVIFQHHVSIGADGFSFVTENPDVIEQARKEGQVVDQNVNQKVYKIPSIGGVVIGDDVEIGANSCVDRGTIENTEIGAQTKIDDLVMVGHNCKIGKACMLVSQCGIAGSCKIGDRVVIAGQAGMADHIEIGSDSIVMAKAGVTKSFPEKSIIIGAPAVPRKDFIKQLKAMKAAEEIASKFKKYEHLLAQFEQDAE